MNIFQKLIYVGRYSTRKFTHENTKVVINYYFEVSDSMKKSFENTIIMILHNDKKIATLSRIVIDVKKVLLNKDKNTAYAKFLNNKFLKIVISDYFFNNNGEKFYKLDEYIHHELAHVWDGKVSDRRAYTHIKELNLMGLLFKNWLTKPKNYLYIFKLRSELKKFQNNLLTEGIAEYMPTNVARFQLHKDASLVEQQLSGSTNKAVENIRELNGLFSQYFFLIKELMSIKNDISKEQKKELKDLYKKIKNELFYAAYPVGLGMVSVMVLKGNYSLEKIAKMHPNRFVTLYEKVACAHDYKPLVTLTGKKGYFSYGEYAKELSELYEEINKKITEKEPISATN